MSVTADPQNFWTIVAAIGQVAGAIATFGAVLVSLHIARDSRRPRAQVRVGERLIIGGTVRQIEVLMFSVANVGTRTFHVRSIGWKTGFLRWGPQCLKQQFAIQLTGGVIGSREPPFEVLPGAEISSYCLMSNVQERTRENVERPFFSRDFSLIGRRGVPVWGVVYTADGHNFEVRAERSLVQQLVVSEKRL
jgi:hypothetical protein